MLMQFGSFIVWVRICQSWIRMSEFVAFLGRPEDLERDGWLGDPNEATEAFHPDGRED